ncbi:MAG: 3-isopropylmalate dehydratase small subunit [Acetanaerobacterium sp.]
MQKFIEVKSVAVAWMMPNVDTDIITPMKRMLTSPTKLDKYAFEPYRFVGGNADTGSLSADFTPNQPQYKNAQIMIVGENFGGGSSRETAPNAIADLGFRCLIGTSFGGIFFKNCFQVGILPISLPKETVERLAAITTEPIEFSVNLKQQKIFIQSSEEIPFEVEPLRRISLMEGLDDVGMILKRKGMIKAFLAQDRKQRPWVYSVN